MAADTSISAGQDAATCSNTPPIKLAILLLCHETPRQLARRLSSPFFLNEGVKVYIHYDGRRPRTRLFELQSMTPPGVAHHFVEERLSCKWGEFSLVEATKRLMQAALSDTNFEATHLALISGSCVPIRPFSSLQRFLEERPGLEFIQAHDVRHGKWIKDGLQEERYQYYFPFNYITQRRWFEKLTDLQRNLKVHRKQPDGLRMHFGSQWFCLTRRTATEVVAAMSDRAIDRFFRHSWIPDEFAVQTLVATLRKPSEIANHNLTYYEFDERGKPLVLDNGHFEHLIKQPFFFARKLAPEANALIAQLDAHTARTEADTGYFARAGQATIDYQRHLAMVMTRKSLRATVGSTKDMWRGPMDSNARYYYVLHASSRAWLLRLVQLARESTGGVLPLFDLPFDRHAPSWAGSTGTYLGFSAQDRYRRDHDPAAYLYEIAHCHALQPAAFGLDMNRGGWIRDFVRWDTNATLVNCDPWISREQRAAVCLDELELARDSDLVRQILGAMAGGASLPGDHADQIRGEGHACQFLNLRDLGADVGDATLLALRNAMQQHDATSYYPSADAAWRRFWRPD